MNKKDAVKILRLYKKYITGKTKDRPSFIGLQEAIHKAVKVLTNKSKL